MHSVRAPSVSICVFPRLPLPSRIWAYSRLHGERPPSKPRAACQQTPHESLKMHPRSSIYFHLSLFSKPQFSSSLKWKTWQQLSLLAVM